jgi:hypothetical protein
MNISVQKLLEKIEEELKLAKNSPKEERLREKIYSIKILCELILDEKQAAKAPAYQPIVAQQPVLVQPAAVNQPKKLEMEDEANGDSLFDF